MTKCVGIADKLQFLACCTPLHYILLFVIGGAIDDAYKISGIIAAELQTAKQNGELRSFVKKFSIHYH